jgi:DUF4097 and DUF4098 domain-containing protein YvlB
MKSSRSLVFACAFLLAFAGCGVNKTIRIADGETVEGGRATVNGGVYIGDGCEVRGSCRTVNGRVTVGTGSRVGGLQTVNGSISLSEEVVVDGDLSAVNGSIQLAENVAVRGEVSTVNGTVGVARGGEVSGDVTTVNGGINIDHAEIDGGLETVTGSISLTDHSRVAKDVVIKGKRKSGQKALQITVDGGSVIEGDIVVREPRRKVTVVLSNGGSVAGEIINAEVIEQDS